MDAGRGGCVQSLRRLLCLAGQQPLLGLGRQLGLLGLRRLLRLLRGDLLVQGGLRCLQAGALARLGGLRTRYLLAGLVAGLVLQRGLLQR